MFIANVDQYVLLFKNSSPVSLLTNPVEKKNRLFSFAFSSACVYFQQVNPRVYIIDEIIDRSIPFFTELKTRI